MSLFNELSYLNVDDSVFTYFCMGYLTPARRARCSDSVCILLRLGIMRVYFFNVALPRGFIIIFIFLARPRGYNKSLYLLRCSAAAPPRRRAGVVKVYFSR